MKGILRIVGAILLIFMIHSCKKIEVNVIKDIDGNVYDTITIGTQVWMKENLKTTKYNDVTAILNIKDNTAWAALTTGAYGDYNNTPANSTIYGALYNWFAVNTGKLCPIGWRVPSDAEWTSLTDFLGGESVAGSKLKETGTTHWLSPNTGATNETGFTALPGGYRDIYGPYNNIEGSCTWWSSTELSTTYAGLRLMTYLFASVTRGSDIKQSGFSVRCLKDN